MRREHGRSIRVAVAAPDSITRAGIAAFLSGRPEVDVLQPYAVVEAEVIVFVPDGRSPNLMSELRLDDIGGNPPVVLIANDITEGDVLLAVEHGVRAILPRSAVAGERLVQTVLTVVASGALLPASLLGQLMRHVEQLHVGTFEKRAHRDARLQPREVDVLRLMAEGLDTAEIAEELCYSERTVKNIIHQFTTRLTLRNRPHAVAYAVRAGVI